ncbi:hypothetical protein BDF14DRAFT_1862279, partial [Spinellus fusiger]
MNPAEKQRKNKEPKKQRSSRTEERVQATLPKETKKEYSKTGKTHVLIKNFAKLSLSDRNQNNMADKKTMNSVAQAI